MRALALAAVLAVLPQVSEARPLTEGENLIQAAAMVLAAAIFDNGTITVRSEDLIEIKPNAPESGPIKVEKIGNCAYAISMRWAGNQSDDLVAVDFTRLDGSFSTDGPPNTMFYRGQDEAAYISLNRFDHAEGEYNGLPLRTYYPSMIEDYMSYIRNHGCAFKPG